MEILEHTHTMGHGVRPSLTTTSSGVVLGLWPRGLPTTFINLAAWEKRTGRLGFPPHPPRSSPCPSGCRRRRAPPGMNDDFRGFRCCFILLPLVSRLAASATEAAATYGVILEALAREFFESSPPKASFRQVPSKQKDTSKPIEVSLFIRIVIYYFIDFWVLI